MTEKVISASVGDERGEKKSSQFVKALAIGFVVGFVTLGLISALFLIFRQ